MTSILALDTSSEACSVALWIDGEITEKFVIEPRKHSALILPMVDALIAESEIEKTQLDALAFGAGPGSFTGLRIACGVIQGMAFGLNLPVIPVSTLAALALQAGEESEVQSDYIFAALDARMDEIFWGCYQYENQAVSVVQADCVCAVSELALVKGMTGIGIGSAYKNLHDDMMNALSGHLRCINESIYPRASYIAKLAVEKHMTGEGVAAEQAQPFYLRNKVAKKPGEK